MKKVYVYLLDDMAECEIGYILQAFSMEKLLKNGTKEFEVKTVSFNKEPVLTLGGLTIVPDYTISEVDFNASTALLLPGSSTWGSKENQEILEKAQECFIIPIGSLSIDSIQHAYAARITYTKTTVCMRPLRSPAYLLPLSSTSIGSRHTANQRYPSHIGEGNIAGSRSAHSSHKSMAGPRNHLSCTPSMISRAWRNVGRTSSNEVNSEGRFQLYVE